MYRNASCIASMGAPSNLDRSSPLSSGLFSMPASATLR